MVPVGKLTVAQMRGLAEIAREFGDGDIRLTVWQNLLISGVPTDRLETRAAHRDAWSCHQANAIRAGLVACTGNTGCKFAASDTKRHAEEIARWCETRIALDGRSTSISPAAIIPARSITSARSACLACKVQDIEEADPVEGYHVLVGGGFGPDAALGRELYRDVKADDAPQTVEQILKAYLAHRASAQESFIAFARRHEIDALKACCRGGRGMSITPRPPIPSFLPDNAPFTPDQRAWLNGLFAGLIGSTTASRRCRGGGPRGLMPGARWRRRPK